MAHTIRPDARYQASYLEAADEFDGAHRDGDGELARFDAAGRQVETFTRTSLADPETFRRFVAWRRADELPATPRRPGYVPCTFLWLVEGDTYLGSVALRHELDDFLLREGGQVGYSVRPSARRQGHATTALREVLEIAGQMGMGRVLITCEEGNVGSRAVIERVGGVYEDSRADMRRYWFDVPEPGVVGVRPH